MSDEMNTSGTLTEESVAEKSKHNGSGPKKHKRNGDPVPGINVRELVEERNWTALAGLGLIVIGLLLVIQHMLHLDLSLWSLALMGVGGWLIFDGWQKYTAANRTWTDTTRHRMMIGGGAVVIGLLSTLQLHWGAILLLGTGAWLGYDTWRRYEAAGRVWTQPTRNRMFVAAALGLLGLFGFIHIGSAWLLLIIIGAVMLYRRNRASRCC